MNVIKKIKEFDYNKNYYLLLIILFCAALRILTPQIIGVGGGDAVESWAVSRNLFFDADYFLIHRTARFATIIPIYLTQALFGTHPLVYYIAPAVASIIQAVFFFKIASIIRGPFFAFVCSLIFLSFPQMIRDVSHPRVSVFASMFFLISLYYALKFYMDCSAADKENKPEIKDLFISGINIFFMYMAKEDSLYFLPAVMLIVFMSRKRFSDLVLFGIVPFSLFLSETLLYYLFTDFKMGRLSIITDKTHFDTVAPLYSWLSLFDRFKGEHLRPYFRYPLLISLIGGIYICIKKRKDENSRINPVFFIVVSLFTYVFLLTFLIKSIHPIIPVNTFRTRYLNIIIPPMILIIMYTLYDTGNLWSRIGSIINSVKKIPSILSVYRKTSSAVFLLLYAFITVSVFYAVYKNDNYKGRSENYFQLHPFKLVYEYNNIINTRYNSGMPFVVRGEKSRNNRFDDVLKTIDGWVESGLTLKQACAKYGITTELYNSYKAGTEDIISFESMDYPTQIFLNPNRKVSGLLFFDKEINGKFYRFFYNSHLTDKDKILEEMKKGPSLYPEIIYSPLEVKFTRI